MKKHFILLGKEGLILFSWIFIVLFIGLIIAYESMEKINWTSIAIVLVFIFLIVYSLKNSYFTKKLIKLPYRSKIAISTKPKTIWTWKKLIIQAIKIDNLQTIYLLTKKEANY